MAPGLLYVESTIIHPEALSEAEYDKWYDEVRSPPSSLLPFFPFLPQSPI
jgi:hypothetical protein